MEFNGFDFSLVTACGECCSCCEKHSKGLCKGCIESDGFCKEWKDSGRCPIHACAKLHDAKFCGLCPEFPCSKLPELINWNPEAVEHLGKLAEIYNLHRRKD